MQPGRTTFRIALVKRINNASEAIEFLLALEQFDRWGNKRIVLDCNAKNAKSILVEHVRKVQLGRRTYHYMLSGLVSIASCLNYEYSYNVALKEYIHSILFA